MTSEVSDWKSFEKYVADIFSMLGYSIEVDGQMDSAQTDIIAISRNRFKPNLIIECKYHSEKSTKVGIDQVENFTARVLKLRNKGVIDQGYLVTNTGFTSPAKGSLAESASYVFLATPNELINELIDTDTYLKTYIESYERTFSFKHFIELYSCDIRNLGFTSYEYTDYFENFASKKEEYLNGEYLLVSMLLRDASTRKLLIKKEDNVEKLINSLSLKGSSDETVTSIPTVNDINELIQQKRNVLKEVTKDCQDFIDGDSNLLILLGDFGSGKTSCFNHLMYLLAKKRLANPDSTPIPLLITLRDYNKAVDLDSLLNNFFVTKLGETNLSIPLFHSLNSKGYFIILLDGFDEMARLVGPVERRQTFNEMSKLINENNKVFLSSRPGYFVDTEEIFDLIIKYVKQKKKRYSVGDKHIPDNVQISCLQLMTNEQLKSYIGGVPHLKKKSALTRILGSNAIIKLAKRPVLANMIIETLEDVERLKDSEITENKIYEIYTQKWIEREEDKGIFRILIGSEKKNIFLGLLAVQLHEQDKFTINYKDLNDEIKKHFKLKDASEIDHFSNDIRTCSFLTRDDNGNYGFIHSSFMEYFVAKEFLKFDESFYTGKFSRIFNPRILEFLKSTNAFGNNSKFWKMYERIKFVEHSFITNQNYPTAILIRGIEKKYLEEVLQAGWPTYDSVDDKIDAFDFKIKKFEDELLQIKQTGYKEMDEKASEILRHFSASWTEVEVFFDDKIKKSFEFEHLIPLRQFISKLKKGSNEKYFRLGYYKQNLIISRSANPKLKKHQHFIQIQSVAIDKFIVLFGNQEYVQKEFTVKNLDDVRLTKLLDELKEVPIE